MRPYTLVNTHLVNVCLHLLSHICVGWYSDSHKHGHMTLYYINYHTTVFTSTYSTALMQRRTRTTLFLDSTGLLEQSAFAILEKIARVANDTLSRSFCEYQMLNRLRLAIANRFAMVATLPFY